MMLEANNSATSLKTSRLPMCYDNRPVTSNQSLYRLSMDKLESSQTYASLDNKIEKNR